MVRSDEFTPTDAPDSPSFCGVYVEPLPDLEWSLTTESHPPCSLAVGPDSLRNGWIQRAPEQRVLELFHRLNGSGSELAAPWWLRALGRGDIGSRATAFELEDRLHTLLASRAGWVFVPWANPGEVGYWEYSPSERAATMTPTTVILTDGHSGWIDVVPAHADPAGAAGVAMNGLAGLSQALPEIECW